MAVLHTPTLVTRTLGRLRQEDGRFKPSLGYSSKLYLRRKKNKLIVSVISLYYRNLTN
jgi:hypothetical protein